MHLLDTSTFLGRPRFSTFWHASLLISSSEQEQQRLNIWDHSETRKKQQVSLWIMILFHLFLYFSISSPRPPNKKSKLFQDEQKYQPQNPGKKRFSSINPPKQKARTSIEGSAVYIARFGVTDPISLGMPTQVGGSTLFFCWVFLVTLKSLVVVSTNENF